MRWKTRREGRNRCERDGKDFRRFLPLPFAVDHSSQEINMQTQTYTMPYSAVFFEPGKSLRFNRGVRTKPEAFFSFQDLADRWRCSRGTVRNRLRAADARVLNFGGSRSKKTV